MSEENLKEEPATIPFFVHENAMMHKDADNERMHKTLRIVCATFLLIILIFVTGYTIRTNIWLKTINDMNNRLVEVTNGLSQQPN